MAALSFTADGKRWLSNVFQPASSNVEVCVRFLNPGGGHVGVLRSVDGVEFTPYESDTVGNLGTNTKLLIFNVSGIVPGAFLRLVATRETDSGCQWRE